MGTYAEAKAIEAAWHPGYTPTIRIEVNAKGETFTPSCASVALARALRGACIASGRGYFDGERIIGQRGPC